MSRTIKLALTFVIPATLSFVIFIALFAQLFLDFTGPGEDRYQSRSDAVAAAIQEGGRVRWPGTNVKVVDDPNGALTVERRWMGLRESTVHAEREPEAWVINDSPRYGFGEAAQWVVGLIVPSAFAFVLTFATLRLMLRRNE